MNPKEEDRSLRKQYADQVLDSARWLNAAVDLLDVVKVVEGTVRQRWSAFHDFKTSVRSLMVHKTFFLLVGLCVEDLLKSRLVKFNQGSLRSQILRDGKLPKSLAGNHDLVALARLAKIQIDAEQQKILRRLSRATNWAGRYPLPRSYKNWEFDDYSSDDVDVMKQFVNNLYDQIHPNH